ncbi:hypothetical protein HAX54_029732 [Datura stramonium]|uniref:Uncharacterized protein n=1 Tax=Datura stramonium TaxID=4076 RepID=A0ABS8RKZ8_DATST|nr:hypothetical protein [Datura stramonium]
MQLAIDFRNGINLRIEKVQAEESMQEEGQAFGAAIRGCEKEAYALCMKLDQKRYRERQAGNDNLSNNNTTIPKELRNLELVGGN